MKLLRVQQRTASEARGITIVIDVIRAFSVAGYAFAIEGGQNGGKTLTREMAGGLILQAEEKDSGGQNCWGASEQIREDRRWKSMGRAKSG